MATAITGIGALLVIAPIIGTPYFGDDELNAPLPKVLSKLHIGTWQYIGQGTVAWMKGGRFFPGAMADEVIVFTTLTGRAAYKCYLVVVLCCLLVAAQRWIALTFGSQAVGLVGVVALASTWELRYPVGYDGLAGYLGLVPWTMLLMVAAVLIVRDRPRRWAAGTLVAGGLVWALSVVTYEYSVILAPAFIAWLWLASNDRTWRRWSAFAIALPSVAQTVFDLYLRHIMTTKPLAEYTISLRAGPFLSTTAKELVSALPLSEYWVPGPAQPALPRATPLALAAVALLGVLLVYSLRRGWGEIPVISAHRLWFAAAIGGWLWLAPAVLTGATVRWQEEVVWGQSYIPMLFETLGISLLAAAGICAVRRGGWDRAGVALTGLMSAALAATVFFNFGMLG